VPQARHWLFLKKTARPHWQLYARPAKLGKCGSLTPALREEKWERGEGKGKDFRWAGGKKHTEIKGKLAAQRLRAFKFDRLRRKPLRPQFSGCTD
jgi:hypothetical protein